MKQMSTFFHLILIIFLFNYFIPEGLVDVFAVGARSPVCFDGTPVDFAGTPDVADGGTLPVCDLSD
jgi:hypothetical protein